MIYVEKKRLSGNSSNNGGRNKSLTTKQKNKQMKKIANIRKGVMKNLIGEGVDTKLELEYDGKIIDISWGLGYVLAQAVGESVVGPDMRRDMWFNLFNVLEKYSEEDGKVTISIDDIKDGMYKLSNMAIKESSRIMNTEKFNKAEDVLIHKLLGDLSVYFTMYTKLGFDSEKGFGSVDGYDNMVALAIESVIDWAKNKLLDDDTCILTYGLIKLGGEDTFKTKNIGDLIHLLVYAWVETILIRNKYGEKERDVSLNDNIKNQVKTTLDTHLSKKHKKILDNLRVSRDDQDKEDMMKENGRRYNEYIKGVYIDISNYSYEYKKEVCIKEYKKIISDSNNLIHEQTNEIKKINRAIIRGKKENNKLKKRLKMLEGINKENKKQRGFKDDLDKANELLNEKTKDISKLANNVSFLNNKVEDLDEYILKLEKENNVYKGKLESCTKALESHNKQSDIDYDELDSIQANKYRSLIKDLKIVIIGGPKNFSRRIKDELSNCDVLIDGDNRTSNVNIPVNTDCLVVYYRVVGHAILIKAERDAKKLGIPVIYLGSTNIGIFCKQIVDGLLEERNREMVDKSSVLRGVRASHRHIMSTELAQ